MSYFLNLFTPETWSAFREHGADISGFRYRQRRVAQDHIKEGDIFLCYMVRLSRWCGVLRIVSPAFQDEKPIFKNPDPFVIRFKVEPVVLLDPEFSLPILDDRIWDALSETKGIDKGSRGWAINFRSSLRKIEDPDGEFLLSQLEKQKEEQSEYPLTDKDRRELAKVFKVRTPSGEISVDVPEDDEDGYDDVNTDVEATTSEGRQSHLIQAKVAKIGIKMGFQIWVPRNDKARVLDHVSDDEKPLFLDMLPINYNDTTLRTIEQIDVIWLKSRSMARAFEVEHTTAVYSGLLRMADLLALQPNMDIRLHIVAPDEKREKVLREIRRPVFSLLERGPLYEKCTFLSYNSIKSLGDTSHLVHMNDSIIEEYEEWAED